MRLTIVLLFSLTAFAQDTHKFFDKTNLAINGFNFAAQTLDMVSTRQFLDSKGHVRPCGPQGYNCYVHDVEGNPLAKPFVSHGWPGSIAYSYGLGVGGNLLVQYVFHRTHHHRIERWFIVAQGASTAGAGIYNAAY